MVGNDHEDRQYVEENRQLELIGERIAELRCSPRPVRLAQGNIFKARLTAAQSRRSEIHHAEHHTEGEQYLDKKWQQDKLNTHGSALVYQDRITKHGSDSSDSHA